MLYIGQKYTRSESSQKAILMWVLFQVESTSDRVWDQVVDRGAMIFYLFTHPVSSVSSSPWVLLRSMVLMKEWLWDDLRKQRHDVARNLLLPAQLHIETSRQQHNERPLFRSESYWALIWPNRTCHPSLLSCWHTKTSIPFAASMIRSG